MATVTSKDGTKIAYDKTGSGPAVILVDGALCFRGFGPMPALAQSLATNFTVYTYDRRGRGESGDTQPYAPEREIEDLEALISEAGGEVFVFGASSGGMLVLRAAPKLPAIKKIATYEIPLNDSEQGHAAATQYTNKLTETLASGDRAGAAELFMTLTGMPPEVLMGMKQSPMWAIFEAVAPTLAYDNAILGGKNELPTELLASVGVPALTMTGGASPEFMRESAKKLADALPKAEFKVLEGQGHEVPVEAITPELIEFFK